MKGVKKAKLKYLCSTFPLLPSSTAQLEGHLLLTFRSSSLAFLLCLHLLLWSLPLSPVSSLFTPGLYSWRVVCCFCFPKYRLFLPPAPPFHGSIYHSLSPSHLSMLPSFHLSLHHFSSGSPLIKPLCLLPPCPASTHTSHTSLSQFFWCFYAFMFFSWPIRLCVITLFYFLKYFQ